MTNLTRAIKVIFVSIPLCTFSAAFSNELPVKQVTQPKAIESTKELGGIKSTITNPAKSSSQLVTPSEGAKELIKIEKPQTLIKLDGEKKNAKYEESWWGKFFTDPIAFFTSLLFLATVALWRSTSQLVVGAERSSQMQLRAYISSVPDFIFSFTQKTPVRMRYTIKNHGQTPAYSVAHTAIVEILPYPIPAGFQFPQLPPLNANTLTLHAGETVFGNVVAQRVFTAQEINDAINNNGRRICCFGYVTYKSFGSTHTTKFCRSIVGCQNLQIVASGTTRPHLDLDYEIASAHNEAD